MHTLTTASESAKSDAPSSRRQILIGLIISAATILTLLAGLELVGYIWERNTAQGPLGWTLVASRRLDLERHGTDKQPYYLFKPDMDYLWEGKQVHINSNGLRTEEFEIPKPPDTYRILNLGDSIVFGWEIQQEDTYGKRLEQSLNGVNDGIKYDVINAGIPAWNLAAERNFLIQEGLDYQPDLVILDITVVNDIYGKGPAISEDQTVFQWLRDHTYFWPFLTTQMRFLMAKRIGPEAIPVLNPPNIASAYYPLEEDHEVWDRLWEYISEMQQASEERGAEFVVLVFPTAHQLNKFAHPDVPQRALASRAAKIGVNIIDLLPLYQQTCLDAQPDACEGYENLLFADVWMHPNELGHSLAAQEVSKWFSVRMGEPH